MSGLVLLTTTLHKLVKWIYSTVRPSLAACLEPLADCQNVASLRLFYRYYFSRCSSELAQLVPLLYCGGRSTFYSDRLHNFSVPFLDVTRMSILVVSFLLHLGSGILCLYNFFL